MSDENVSFSKNTMYHIVIGILAIALVASILTGGFGIVTPNNSIQQEQNTTTTEEEQINEETNPEENQTSEEPTEEEFVIDPAEVPVVPFELFGSLPPKGDASAPISIIEFSDYECPYCAGAEGENQEVLNYLKSRNPSYVPAMPKIKSDYVDSGKVRVYFRDIPFHEKSMLATTAARCANEQDKFWEMHGKLFEEQENWMDQTPEVFNDTVRAYGVDIGLNETQYEECLTNRTFDTEVQEDLAVLQGMGMGGTPTFAVILDKERTDLDKLSDLIATGEYGLGATDEGDYVVIIRGASPFETFDEVLKTVN